MLPPSLTRTGGRSPTRVGTIDPAVLATVDDRGLVSIERDLGGWSLDWWIGADDRWHVPAREAAVRQRLVAAAPVVETAVRIPSGDALHRVFGVRGPAFDGGDQYLVVEVENASPVPFALALVVRPFTSVRVAEIGEIVLAPTTGGHGRDRAQVVSLDGVPALLLPKAPARAAAGSRRSGDVLGIVTDGEAAETFSGAHDPDGTATAAFLFPVPHKAVIRVVLPLDARRAPPVAPCMAYPTALPDAERVANGWALQMRRCPCVEVPDTRLAQGIEATRRALLLDVGATDVAATADRIRALDREGFQDEAARILASASDRMSGAGLSSADAVGWLSAAVGHWRLARDDLLGEMLLPELVMALRLVERDLSPRRSNAGEANAVDPIAIDSLAGLAELLAALGQPDAAGRVLAIADAGAAAVDAGSGADPLGEPRQHWRELSDLVGSASSTWTWPDEGLGRDDLQRSTFLATVRTLLVAERERTLAVLPAGPGPWYLQSVSLRHAPTRWGRFSFAVRWHGDRPALLWDLEAHAGTATATITAPGLDPSWSTSDRRGEALLATFVPSERAGASFS